MKEAYLTVKELPVTERPYEKCEAYGASYLSDAELLAVILRTGSKGQRVIDLAQKVLLCHPYEKGLLGITYLSLQDFRKIKGIGRIKAIELACVAELSKRISKSQVKEKVRLCTPETVARYYMEDLKHLRCEQVHLVLLDTKNHRLADCLITSGTVNASLISPREILLTALKHEAVYMILVHNHPSGDPTPSSEDIKITKRLFEAGNLVGVTLMDHIIIGDNIYISLKQLGYL